MSPEILQRAEAVHAARAAAAEDEAQRIRVLSAGLCPTCGGDTRRGSELLSLLTGRTRYVCTACGDRHDYFFDD